MMNELMDMPVLDKSKILKEHEDYLNSPES